MLFRSDAVIRVFKKGELKASMDNVLRGETETLTTILFSGWYVIEIFDYDVVSTPYSGEECMDVAIN